MKGKQKVKEDREKSKGKYCKNCKKLNTRHKPKNYFIINKKLYYKWKEKTDKKIILYQEFNKKKLGSKSRKEEHSSNSLDNNNAYSDLNNSNTYISIKKELGYLYVHLNKKN